MYKMFRFICMVLNKLQRIINYYPSEVKEFVEADIDVPELEYNRKGNI